MIKSKTDKQTQQKPLRLLPGVIIVVIQWLLWVVIPIVIVEDLAIVIGVFGGMLGGLVLIVWWAFFSRAPRIERWGATVLMIVALVGTFFIIHESIATAMMGMMYFVYAIPVLSLVFIIWAATSYRFSDGLRRLMMVVTILAGCGVWALVRSDGINSNAAADFTWRWTTTSEEKLLAQIDDESLEPLSIPISTVKEANWPGFRGTHRDGIIHGVRIETNWSTSPPVELWRRRVGPGCSSFAAHGTLFYTQEQRGDEEIVSCYDVATGKSVWKHRDKARFWDSHAGAGPRGTPTLNNGRVYTFGATGILNVLDARDGTLVWSRNAASDTDTKDSGWGFSSSPLVVDDIVIVAATGKLVAYDIATGELCWLGPDGGDSYSSPHLLMIDSVKQVLLMNAVGVISVAPSDGSLLWDYPWPRETRIVQPAQIKEGDVLISAGERKGICRLEVGLGSDGWKIEERWTSNRIRPDFNDFVVHNGHVYGFTGPSLACLDIKKGERKWKGNRYIGQLLLLAEQELLLVLSEKGELVLVKASPDQFSELARFPAIEGKTWNHPALAGDVLLVRNGMEMAGYRLSLSGNE